MESVIALFPGQGSQYVGMGDSLWAHSARIKALFEEADDTLQFKLSKLMHEGPKERLTETAIAQPAILLHSYAAFLAALDSLPLPFKAFMGHSLGEYTALVAAGVLDFATAIDAVHKRGRFMQMAVPLGQGAMAAVLGLSAPKIMEVCQSVSLMDKAHYVAAANLNGPLQTVISGTALGVQKAGEFLKEEGARRVVPLEVSAPFHCDLMKPAQINMAQLLSQISFRDAKIPVITNVSATPIEKGEELRKLLVDQVTSPVRFSESIEWVKENHPQAQFIEYGPGKILSGLVSRMWPSAKVFSIEQFSDISEVGQNFKTQ